MCLDSGSGRIGIILPDLDPFQPHVKLNHNIIFPENFNIMSEILKIKTVQLT